MQLLTVLLAPNPTQFRPPSPLQAQRLADMRARLARVALGHLRPVPTLAEHGRLVTGPTALAAQRMLEIAAPAVPAAALAPPSMHTRSFNAAAVLLADAKAGGQNGAALLPPTNGAPPPLPATAAGSGSEDSELDSDDEAAAEAMAEAFERLIGAAFEMVQQGKPMEAEYVLSEGGCWVHVGAQRSRVAVCVCSGPAAMGVAQTPEGRHVQRPALLLLKTLTRRPPPPLAPRHGQAQSRPRRSWAQARWSWWLSTTSCASSASCMSAWPRRPRRPSRRLTS